MSNTVSKYMESVQLAADLVVQLGRVHRQLAIYSELVEAVDKDPIASKILKDQLTSPQFNRLIHIKNWARARVNEADEFLTDFGLKESNGA